MPKTLQRTETYRIDEFRHTQGSLQADISYITIEQVVDTYCSACGKPIKAPLVVVSMVTDSATYVARTDPLTCALAAELLMERLYECRACTDELNAGL